MIEFYTNFTKIMILLTNDFTERTILPNDRSVRKRKKYIYINNNLLEEQNHRFFERLKNERWVVHKR